VEACLGVPVESLARRPLDESTSFACEFLDVVAGGRTLPLFFKDYDRCRLPREDGAGMRREIEVYRRLLDPAALGTPRHLGSQCAPQDGHSWLLLEHARGARLAKRDARNWNAAAAWLGRLAGHWAARGRDAPPGVLAVHDLLALQAVVEEARREVASLAPRLARELRSALVGHETLLEVLADQPPTLVHGSFRPQNILVDADAAPAHLAPVDWEHAALGCALYDVAFLTAGLERERAAALVAAQAAAAAECGQRLPPPDEAWELVRILRLHKFLRSLSRARRWAYEREIVEHLIVLVGQHCRDTLAERASRRTVTGAASPAGVAPAASVATDAKDALVAEGLDVQALCRLLAAPHPPGPARVATCQLLKRGILRVGFEVGGRAGSAIVKRTAPEIARRNQFVSDRWLPAAGLSSAAPATHGILTGPDPACVWLVSDDLGAHTFASLPRAAARTQAAIAAVAALHRQFADHAVLGEVRHYGGDLGPAFLHGNLRDALRALRALAAQGIDADGPRAATRARLAERLAALLDDAPCRADLLVRRGGPETLLHGDLWLENLVEVPAGQHTGQRAGQRARQRARQRTGPATDIRLIDWDHAAVGPALYDVSTLLYRFPRGERRALWALYVRALGTGAWTLPDESELALICETTEHARIANRVIWPALAALRGPGEDALVELDEVASWFDLLEPLFP
jgi:thiamine kinase-like enzyme